MLDLNWETLNGDVAHQIEAANAANQANVLTCLIQFLTAHRIAPDASAPPPDEAALLMLHNAGTLLLLANPGTYRNINVEVKNPDGSINLKPIDWQFVDGQMKAFFRRFSSLWQFGNPLVVAAYSLWAINHIHPFRNGNGRTARAFSYLALSVKQGAEPPGEPNIVKLMQQDPYRSEYVELLKEADKSAATNNLNLQPLMEFILKLLNIQIATVSTHTILIPEELAPPAEPSTP